MYSFSMSSLFTDPAGQHVALLLEEAERERVANQARAARRRRRQPHRVRRTIWGHVTAALFVATRNSRWVATASREVG